jgi:hypothetical protein
MGSPVSCCARDDLVERTRLCVLVSYPFRGVSK